ncbi:NAD(P)/FAD-dependent oxidoreductase [Limoniibacter endophyticus]|uniref:Oxidoreductase n=1 Tax=Limoniibacter endophyticus TaxID=1565040 RepID=A0A8J3DK38_9HYPH|nr:FAD-binding oxidoreductase [Limoniibacter endophyticus]GHC80073.1 oxidoreductase [Limoniibacter endophyticus]
MYRNRDHGLWEKTAPAAPATSPLLADIVSDVVILGGGYTGLSAALHLAKRGVKAVVLEAESIGFGGSGRNVGLVNAGMWVMPDDLPGVLGKVHGDRLLQTLGSAPDLVYELIDEFRISCQAVRNGTLHCAVGADGLQQLRDRESQWRARGADVELLGRREAARLIGTAAYEGALLDRRAGTVQPLAYARGLATAAIQSGAIVHTNSPVTKVEQSGPRWTAFTPHGRVLADWVIVATNAYTHAPWESIAEELVLLPYFNLATEPLPREWRERILPERQGAWDTREVLTSFRWDDSGRLVFGSVGALRNTGLNVHATWARRAMKKLFPGIGNVGFEEGWYGMIGMTDDSLPKFHQLGKNVVTFAGYNGRGIGTGTVFGKILSELISGDISSEELPLPVSLPKSQPFRKIRSIGYEMGAQALHLVEKR